MSAFTSLLTPIIGDPDIVDYLMSSVESLTIEEKKNASAVMEIVGPFLVEGDYVKTEEEALRICQQIAQSYGGSGFKVGNKMENTTSKDDAPLLLSVPIKIIDSVVDVIKPKHTYGGSHLGGEGVGDNIDGNVTVTSNSQYQAASIPITQKQIRKQRKENEALQKMLRHEAMIRKHQEDELRAARMAAIIASRTASRQANKGVNIDSFSIPHPSGTGELLSDVSLTLAPTRRYALVGRNGAGKSTLMRALAHYKLPNLNHLRILLVDQHVEGDNESPLEWCLRADVERTSLLEDEEKLTKYMHAVSKEELPEELKNVNIEVALLECYERMEAIGVSTAENRSRKILQGLGFSPDAMTTPTSQLSGGWCMRAALASAIFVNPNLLLLDEPTNHLDIYALLWLEHYLTTQFEGIAVVVSHDRYFLDAICTDVLELRSKLAGHSKASLEHYYGDYATYESTVAENKLVQQRAKEAYEREKEKLKEFISREGKKYDNPAHQSQRKMKIKQLESLLEVEPIEDEVDVQITLPTPFGVFDKNEKMLGIADVSFKWNDADKEPLFEGVDFVVKPRARIAIMGKNGCGKTSLLNILTGECPPTTGTVSKHIGCRIQMLQQHHYKGEQLDPNLNALEHIKRLHQDTTSATGLLDPGSRQEETTQRAYLSNFGIVGNFALLAVKYLSGGQRMRVALAIALFRRPDVLILDEPTNHCDSYFIKALCNALHDFDGAIIAVSHDESFVNKVIQSNDSTEDGPGGELWVLASNKLIRYDGDFASYKKQIMKKVVENN